jgi:hypothetical protein
MEASPLVTSLEVTVPLQAASLPRKLSGQRD